MGDQPTQETGRDPTPRQDDDVTPQRVVPPEVRRAVELLIEGTPPRAVAAFLYAETLRSARRDLRARTSLVAGEYRRASTESETGRVR